MTQPNPRFVAFIQRACASLDAAPPHVEGDSYRFLVGEQWVEFKLGPGDDEVMIAALAFMRGPDVTLRADLIAEFNMRNLFDGGYSLVVTEESFAYLCQPHALVNLDAGRIRETLVQFMQRAEAVYEWYADRLGETPTEIASSPPPSAEEGDAIRV